MKKTRILTFLFVAVLALSVTACSNNKGKIEGKWKATQMPSVPSNVNVFMEFGSDNSFKLNIAGAVITGKYRLGFGDNVTLYDLSEELSNSKKHTEKITIRGDELTMEDSDGTVAKFKRVVGTN